MEKNWNKTFNQLWAKVTSAIKYNIKRKEDRINDVTLVDGVPLFSWVELNINELCNRTCVFCPRHDPKQYPNQNLHMDLTLAESIATQLKDLGFKGIVNISGTGEALLTKHLVNLVKKFGDKNIQIEIVTNGDKLKPKLIKDLYAAGLTQLVVSMYDGPEQIDHFNTLFEECGINSELYTLRDRWYDEDEDYGLIYTNRAGTIGKKLSRPEQRGCNYPHYALYIDWNGDVLLCCQDMYNRTIVLGNVTDTPIFDIWTNTKLTGYRHRLKSGDRSAAPCNSCNANGLIFGHNHANAWQKQ